MRRGPMFGWQLVRTNGSSVYSVPKKHSRISERLMRELFGDDGRLDLERLKNEGWFVAGSIKED